MAIGGVDPEQARQLPHFTRCRFAAWVCGQAPRRCGVRRGHLRPILSVLGALAAAADRRPLPPPLLHSSASRRGVASGLPPRGLCAVFACQYVFRKRVVPPPASDWGPWLAAAWWLPVAVWQRGGERARQRPQDQPSGCQLGASGDSSLCWEVRPCGSAVPPLDCTRCASCLVLPPPPRPAFRGPLPPAAWLLPGAALGRGGVWALARRSGQPSGC